MGHYFYGAGGNATKTPFARSLHDFGDVKVQDWLQRQTQAMPATVVAVMGSYLKVKIDGKWAPFLLPEIVIPKTDPAYIRTPTQVGDHGFLLPVAYYMGGMSGQGGGQADNVARGNLTNVIWSPVSNKSFTTVDTNALVLGGSNGCVLQDTGGSTVITIQPTLITISCGSGQIVKLKADGSITVTPKTGKSLFLGGDPAILGSFAPVVTTGGNSINVQARYA